MQEGFPHGEGEGAVIDEREERSVSWLNKAMAGRNAHTRYKGVMPKYAKPKDAPWREGWFLAEEGKDVMKVYRLGKTPRIVGSWRVDNALDALKTFEKMKQSLEEEAAVETIPPERKAELLEEISFLADCVSNAGRTVRLNKRFGKQNGNGKS